MKSSKTNSSSLRYFVAGLKPFGNVMFWLPLAILGLLFFMVWQYRTHPQWLNRAREQPKTIEDSIIENQKVLPTNPEAATSPLNGLPQQPSGDSVFQQSGNNNEGSPRPFLQDKTETNSEQIQPSLQTNSDKKPKPQLFQPWQTNVKSNPSSGGLSTIKPVQIAPIPVENHLQKAMEKEAQSGSNLNNSNLNSSTNSSENLPNLNINNKSSFSNSQSSNSTEQLPTNNTLTQPVQPSIQPYQVPYNNYSPGPQQAQPPANPYQVPYNNYPTQPQTNNFSGQSNLAGQGNSVAPNPYSRPAPQIQPAIR